MAQVPEESQRIASYPVVFEGSWYGSKPITRRDNSPATTKAGEPLHACRLVSSSGEFTDAFSVTVVGKNVPPMLAQGATVRVPGTISVTRKGERVYVNAWGNYVELVSEAS